MLVSDAKHASGKGDAKPLSVTEALKAAKGALENLRLRIVGEVSEVNVKEGYAKAYFTLKDENGTLPCQMWRDRYEKTGVTLRVGMKVELTGQFSLWPKKGRMHFEASAISIAGEGFLRQQVDALKEKLAAEGLMDPAKKVPVPQYPLKIGVVTSPRGDAIRDVLRTTRRRFPLAHLYVAGVAVEGASAPQQMIEGMRACYRARVDVILLVRGGGSFEDLMPFNDEALARAISKCPIPVVTGIAHEGQTTIADLVGDLRASTPTGAAEAVTVSADQLIAELRATGKRLANRESQILGRAALSLERYSSRPLFRDPRSLFASDLMTVDVLHDRLSRALPANIRHDATRLAALSARLAARPVNTAELKAALDLRASRLASSTAALERRSLRLQALRDRLREASSNALAPHANALALRAGRLHDLSPLSVLARGYAIARRPDGAIVKRAAELELSDTIEVSFADGRVSATIDSIRLNEGSDQ